MNATATSKTFPGQARQARSSIRVVSGSGFRESLTRLFPDGDAELMTATLGQLGIVPRHDLLAKRKMYNWAVAPDGRIDFVLLPLDSDLMGPAWPAAAAAQGVEEPEWLAKVGFEAAAFDDSEWLAASGFSVADGGSQSPSVWG